MSENQPMASAGWYPDPKGVAPLRYWSGHDWSSWTSDGTTLTEDELGPRRQLSVSDLSHLDFVE